MDTFLILWQLATPFLAAAAVIAANRWWPQRLRIAPHKPGPILDCHGKPTGR